MFFKDKDSFWRLSLVDSQPSQRIRLRAVSLFSVVRPSKMRDTQTATRVTDARGLLSLNLKKKRDHRPRFARLAASPLPRACTALTESEEKERLLAVYNALPRQNIPHTR